MGSYSLPFFCTSVPLSLTVILPVLKADPVATLAELALGSIFGEASFVQEASYLAFHCN